MAKIPVSSLICAIQRDELWAYLPVGDGLGFEGTLARDRLVLERGRPRTPPRRIPTLRAAGICCSGAEELSLAVVSPGRA
jgi:hypothetical protein